MWKAIRSEDGYCGMSLTIDADRRLMLTFDLHMHLVSVSATKSSWEMGGLGRLAVDGVLDEIATARGDTISAAFMPERLAAITAGLAHTQTLTVRFLSGNEPPWSFPASGAGEALQQFNACVADYNRALPLSAVAPPFIPRIGGYGFSGPAASGVAEVPFIRDRSGMILLQVGVDGVPMQFMLDSGSSGISIPQDAFERLQREGRITESDYRHQVDVTLANGRHERVRSYMLQQVTIGGRTLYGVECLIGRPGSGYLLGQSVLEQFGSVTIDNKRAVIRLET